MQIGLEMFSMRTVGKATDAVSYCIWTEFPTGMVDFADSILNEHSNMKVDSHLFNDVICDFFDLVCEISHIREKIVGQKIHITLSMLVVMLYGFEPESHPYTPAYNLLRVI